MPSEFIPIAEKNGLIINITWMILEKVCRFLSTNKNFPIDSISINFSIQQFQHKNIGETLLSILEKYDVHPSKIKIEITERVFAEDMEKVLSIMEMLRGRGIGFYLDDFGTGYSNLSRISHLPFECIKIDRSMMDNLDDKSIMQLLKSIIFAIKLSDKKIIIEGIENEQHVNRIKELDIDMIQGFYYALPVSEDEFIKFINGQYAGV